jgi:hypothetical protein
MYGTGLWGRDKKQETGDKTRGTRDTGEISRWTGFKIKETGDERLGEEMKDRLGIWNYRRQVIEHKIQGTREGQCIKGWER